MPIYHYEHQPHEPPAALGRDLLQKRHAAVALADYLAAYPEMTTNNFEHTGTQSVARAAITRAVAEI